MLIAQQVLNGLVVGAVYALFALGFTLVYGVQKILNLAHGGIFMWGALIGLFVVTRLGLSLWAALVVAMAGAGILSILLELIAFRHLRRRKGDDLSALVSSIGANLILVNLAQQATNSQIQSFPFGTFPIRIFRVAGLVISLQTIVILGCVALLVTMLVLYLFRTHFGAEVRAVAVNQRTAVFLGIAPESIFLQTFFIAGAMAGAAGVILGVAFNSVSYDMGEPMMLRAFVIIVLGGFGSVIGAVVAGLILGVVQALSIAFLSSALSDAMMFSVLILLLLVRPTGLFRGFDTEARRA
jgi:branched-chain amino acid transport system permease protein